MAIILCVLLVVGLFTLGYYLIGWALLQFGITITFRQYIAGMIIGSTIGGFFTRGNK